MVTGPSLLAAPFGTSRRTGVVIGTYGAAHIRRPLRVITGYWRARACPTVDLTEHTLADLTTIRVSLTVYVSVVCSICRFSTTLPPIILEAVGATLCARVRAAVAGQFSTLTRSLLAGALFAGVLIEPLITASNCFVHTYRVSPAVCWAGHS